MERSKNGKYIIGSFFNFIDKPLISLTSEDIDGWIQNLGDRGAKYNTKVRNLRYLKSFFKYCYGRKIIPRMDNLLPKLPWKKRLPVYLEQYEIPQVREAARLSSYHQLITELLYCTGIRCAEAANITLTNINLEDSSIFIENGKNLKSRYVYFSSRCKEYLVSYLEERGYDGYYLFLNNRGCPATAQKIRDDIDKIMNRTNLPKRVTPKAFRHTFAVTIWRKGVPIEIIQVLLGHENIKTTVIYLESLFDPSDGDMDKYM
jgi:Site-specific recombinase XerD